MYPEHSTIKTWAEADRPREKLLLKGKENLTDAELLGILINAGVQHLTAVDIARGILGSVKNDLHDLGKLSVKDLAKHKGIGEARAITIVAALELGRRRRESAAAARTRITSAKDAFSVLRPYFADLPHEEFWVLLLNRANEVLKPVRVSVGGVAGTVADPKVIFKSALENLASGIILAHNHPSGNLTPSSADISLTKQLRQAGKWFELPVLDHLILYDERFFSFADEGLLN